MKYQKQILLIIIFLLIPFKSSAVIKNGMFATVGNKTITHFDIVNEAKIILILNVVIIINIMYYKI